MMLLGKILLGIGSTAVLVIIISIVIKGFFFLIHHQLFGDFCYCVKTSENVVALTYDDGPDPVSTKKILDILKQHEVKATFFMVGERIKKYPEIARAVYQDKHELGNHSFSHTKMIFKPPTFVRLQIEKTDALLKDLGVSAEIHFRSPFKTQLFILPYILYKMKKKNILWDIDSQDWKIKNTELVAEHVLKLVKPGSIILLHDSRSSMLHTIEATDIIIKKIKEMGYSFKTVNQLLKCSYTRGH